MNVESSPRPNEALAFQAGSVMASWTTIQHEALRISEVFKSHGDTETEQRITECMGRMLCAIVPFLVMFDPDIARGGRAKNMAESINRPLDKGGQ